MKWNQQTQNKGSPSAIGGPWAALQRWAGVLRALIETNKSHFQKESTFPILLDHSTGFHEVYEKKNERQTMAESHAPWRIIESS